MDISAAELWENSLILPLGSESISLEKLIHFSEKQQARGNIDIKPSSKEGFIFFGALFEVMVF